jgi:hypothetical protein
MPLVITNPSSGLQDNYVQGWKQTYNDASSMANQAPTTGDAGAIMLKKAANENGWTTTRSSDGTNSSSSGDVIGTTVANLAHSNAYFNLNSPDGLRSLMWQRGTTSRSAKLIVVGSAGWNTDGNATTIPTPVTANDAKGLIGNSATPAFATTYWGTDNDYFVNVAVQTISPYGLYMFCTQKTPGSTGATGLTTTLFIDPIWFGGQPNDPDPCVYYATPSGQVVVTQFVAAGGFITSDVDDVSSGPRGWLGKGATNGGWVALNGVTYNGQGGQAIPFNACASLIDGADVPLPMLYVRGNSVTTLGPPYGAKGFSSIFRLTAQSRGIGNMGSWTSPGSNDGIQLAGATVPWPCAATLSAGP